MNSVLKILLDNIDSPTSRFIFPTDTAASRWADYLLRVRGGTVAMNKFTAWDVFKQDSIKSKVKDKKSVPSALRKIFVSRLVNENSQNYEKGTPVFTSLIRAKWAKQAAHFAPWLTGILPQLGVWFKKSAGLPIETVLSEKAKTAAQNFEGDDRDLFVLACRYAQFLEEHGLFEPAWETPPFNDDGKEYFIFFPQSLSDFGEYRELLKASSHVKIIDVLDSDVPFDTFFYANSRGEITEAALYIRALNEKEGVDWDSIAVCIPDSENYEPYVLREFANRNIPFVKRVSKPVTGYPAGSFFRSVIECASGDFAFSALVSLVLNKNLPWKDASGIDNLVEFGIKNNCICSWEEISEGNKQKLNVWEDAFKNPLGGIDPETKKFYGDLKRRLQSFRASASFAELRRQYFIFRENFFDMEKCSRETDLILSRCIAELMYLCEIEKDFPDVKAVDPFLFYTEYLGEVNYLAQSKFAGVNILPYKTAAAAPYDCHIILGAGQDSLSVVYSRLDFLPRKKREKLGIPDEDASSVFIELHKFNSVKRAAFFCGEQTFSGFTIPHSKINAPAEPKERYASDPRYRDKFSDDLYGAENLIPDNGAPEKLHENQIDGFENWINRRKQPALTGGGGNAGKTLQKLIKDKFAYKKEMPDKYGVSSSSLADYYQCSLKWLFGRVLKLENEQIDVDLMADIAGMVYHAALNLFFTEIKEKKEALLNPVETERGFSLPDEYLKLLEKSVNKIFNSFPKLQEGEGQMMSVLTARLLSAQKKQFQFNLENCLAHFLSLFCGCFVKNSEISYLAPRDDYFLNGKIDCILEDRTGEESKFIIVDFKSAKLPKRADCAGGEEDELRDFQLPMYITLAEENEKIEVHTALFYSILFLKPEVVIGVVEDKYNETTTPKKEGDRILRNKEKYNQLFDEFNKKTKQFADEIKTANFSVFESDYNECNKCEYNRICRTVYIIDREKNISLGND
jgi:hypothetical protein